MVGVDRQLAVAGGDHLPGHADLVAEIDARLPQGQHTFSGALHREHDLQCALALLQHRKDQPSEVAHRPHASRHRDHLPGMTVGSQSGMRGHDLRHCGTARHRPRVRRDAGELQSGSLAVSGALLVTESRRRTPVGQDLLRHLGDGLLERHLGVSAPRDGDARGPGRHRIRDRQETLGHG